MSEGFDTSNLDRWAKMLKLTEEQVQTLKKSFLQKEGNKLKRRTNARARAVGTVSGSYKKSIKRGKVWSKGDNTSVRVFSNEPHAHLVEDGHYQVLNPPKGKGMGRGVKKGKGIGRRIGYVPGRKVFQKGYQDFASTYEQDCETMVDEMIKKL